MKPPDFTKSLAFSFSSKDHHDTEEFDSAVTIQLSKVIDTEEFDSAVTIQLSGVIDTEESDSAVSLIPLSQALPYHWNLWISYDTAEFQFEAIFKIVGSEGLG